MAFYISKKDQEYMQEQIDKFLEVTEDGVYKTQESDRIMHDLFTNYFDKIIDGVIKMPNYQLYKFGDYDSLKIEGQVAIYKSILKRQWKEYIPKKDKITKEIIEDEDGNPIMVKGASLFSFYTTVVVNNIKQYTKRVNDKKSRYSTVEIEEVYDHDELTYVEDNDLEFLIDEIFDELRDYFEDKERFIELTNLLERHFYQNIGKKKFIKKHFLKLAEGHTFSNSFVNTFFSHIKKNPKIKRLLFDDK